MLSDRIEMSWKRLRRGHALRAGRIALIRTKVLFNILERLRIAELDSAKLRTTREETRRNALNARPQRSVVFLHNAYYNFLHLAAALRKRGWDAVSVSLEDPNGPNAKFYHGEDHNLFDPDPQRFERNLRDFFDTVMARFHMVHFYGRGQMSFFPAYYDHEPEYEILPVDFLRLRQLGVKIGYSVCGCLDGVAQSSVHRWSHGACDRCVHQHNARLCQDKGNLAWGHKVSMICDLIATEGFPALDWQHGDKVYREPLTTALDQDFWRPDLEIPDRYRLAREPGELIVYHAVGNYLARSREGRNLKGTGAVVSAVERLRGEGRKVRLEFVTDVPSTDVRFLQVQADIIVDQLNYGRYGATAREGMMLGRPTVCCINRDEPPGAAPLESIETCPLVNADEATIYDVLKDLLDNEPKRLAIGRRSRDFAVKWHSADACAERFERVYDRLILSMPPVEQGFVQLV